MYRVTYAMNRRGQEQTHSELCDTYEAALFAAEQADLRGAYHITISEEEESINE